MNINREDIVFGTLFTLTIVFLFFALFKIIEAVAGHGSIENHIEQLCAAEACAGESTGTLIARRDDQTVSSPVKYWCVCDDNRILLYREGFAEEPIR